MVSFQLIRKNGDPSLSPSSKSLPAMAGHTMTLVGTTTLYVIGGMSVRNYYSEDTYVVDIATNQWEVMRSIGGGGAGGDGGSGGSGPAMDTAYSKMGSKPTG